MSTLEKEKISDDAAIKCNEYRKQGYHCSESAIRGVSDALGITLTEDLLRVSSGFRGGGGGELVNRCGILEAGIMLISLLYGRIDSQSDTSDYCYLIRILHNRFYSELGGIDCRILRPFAYYLSGEEQNCSYTYKIGAKIVAMLLLEAKELIQDMPVEETDDYRQAKLSIISSNKKYPYENFLIKGL